MDARGTRSSTRSLSLVVHRVPFAARSSPESAITIQNTLQKTWIFHSVCRGRVCVSLMRLGPLSIQRDQQPYEVCLNNACAGYVDALKRSRSIKTFSSAQNQAIADGSPAS